MDQMRRFLAFGLVAAAAWLIPGTAAQVGDPATLIQEKLASQIKLTKAAADHSDIVTAGDIVLLHKDGLMMCSSTSPYAFSNTYNNGVLSANLNNRAKSAMKSFAFGRIPVFGGGGSATDAMKNGCTSRKFVAGEKFWVTGISLQKDGILVSTISDPYNDVRYFGEVKFPFPSGHVPPADTFAQTVAELLTVVPSDDKGDKDAQSGPQPKGDQQAKQAAPAPAPAASAPMPDIAPPPPPADAPPPTIAVGQTKDQVTAAFGKPAKEAKIGAKEIFYYKDMKVTFTNGKVTNVD